MASLIEEAQEILRRQGREDLANELTRLMHSEQVAQHAARHNYKACCELRDKYEPRPPTPDCWKNNWTGD